MARWIGPALMVASTLVTFALSEGVVRIADGGAFRHLPLYRDDPAAGIRLAADAEARLWAPDGSVQTIRTDGDGLRPTGAEGPSWLALGDSQVLGLGVAEHESFPARLTALGQPTRAVAVPGYGVEDAARLAGVVRRPDTLGLLVVVNQANDWGEVGAPVASRFVVEGGWLLPADRAGAAVRGFFASGLSRVHLLHHLVVLGVGGASALAPPALEVDPARTRALADAITRLRDDAGLPVVVAFLPVDLVASPGRREASPFARAAPAGWTPSAEVAEALRAALPDDLPWVDLTGALTSPDSFLDRDYHLSAAGHARVAERLATALAVAPRAPSPR